MIFMIFFESFPVVKAVFNCTGLGVAHFKRDGR
jgi:hypothetical protein